MNTEYLTQTKFDEFKKELETLKTTRRTEIANQLEYAKSLGDLSENAEYHEARTAQAMVEDRIGHLENLLKSVSIVSPHAGDIVAVGSVIALKREDDETKKSFTIVGSEESDATNGKISVRSPLGAAAMGKAKGESFTFISPSGPMTYKVVDIK